MEGYLLVAIISFIVIGWQALTTPLPPEDHIKAIKKLKELYDSGIISKQEFEKGVNNHINSGRPDDCKLFSAEVVLKEYKALLEDGIITRVQYEKRAEMLIKIIRKNAKL